MLGKFLDDGDDLEIKKPKQIECPSCGGFGFVTVGNEDEPDCNECSEEVTCDDCKGAGLVDEED